LRRKVLWSGLDAFGADQREAATAPHGGVFVSPS
jgi:hypothetical protein